jgi:hypothetical protein
LGTFETKYSRLAGAQGFDGPDEIARYAAHRSGLGINAYSAGRNQRRY